jgi:hypothetical protein
MMLLGAVSTLVIALLMAATLGMLLLTGRVWRRARPPRHPGGLAADDALRRHPAGRARHEAAYPGPAIGPDDDPEFINALEWLVRGGEPDEEL